MIRFAAALLATGCLSVPAYEPERSVSYTEAGAGARVTGPDFVVHFADGDGFHFPDALLIDDNDVLGHERMPACFDEDESGFLISPTPRISAHGPAVPVASHLIPVLRGPAVVQVKVEWATRFACNTARAPGGTSTFTVFPDGRILRHDLMVDPSSSSISGTQCACKAGPALFTVSSYWTLARAPFHDLYAPDQRPPPDSTQSIVNYDAACLDAGAYQLAFGWREADNSTISGSDAVLIVGRDMVLGASSLGAYSWENSFAFFIGRTGCSDAYDRATEHAHPSPLTIGDRVVMPAARDGIYGGDGGDGHPGIELASDRVELTGPTNSSFAVWLRFPRPLSALRARLERASGPWYLPQQVDDRTWIIWFRDSISAAQKITLEPL